MKKPKKMTRAKKPTRAPGPQSPSHPRAAATRASDPPVAVIVMWNRGARGVATAALRAAGLEYLAYDTLVEVDELSWVIEDKKCKAVKVDWFFADEDDIDAVCPADDDDPDAPVRP
jgi:hypothetical protein